MRLPDERVRELVREISRLTRERDQEAKIATAWVQRYDRVAAEAKAFCEEKNQAVRERDEARAQRDLAKRVALTHQAERDRLRALLREVEWHGGSGTVEVACCPLCYGHGEGPFKGHASDCRLAAALEGRDAAD